MRANFQKCKMVLSLEIDDFEQNKNRFRHGQSVLETVLASTNNRQSANLGALVATYTLWEKSND